MPGETFLSFVTIKLDGAVLSSEMMDNVMSFDVED